MNRGLVLGLEKASGNRRARSREPSGWLSGRIADGAASDGTGGRWPARGTVITVAAVVLVSLGVYAFMTTYTELPVTHSTYMGIVAIACVIGLAVTAPKLRRRGARSAHLVCLALVLAVGTFVFLEALWTPGGPAFLFSPPSERTTLMTRQAIARAPVTGSCRVVRRAARPVLPLPYEFCFNHYGAEFSIDWNGSQPEGFEYGGGGPCSRYVGDGWWAFVTPDPNSYPAPSCPADFHFVPE